MVRTKYPLEVGSVVRKNKTFSITSHLSRANAYDNDPPYLIYNKFSRFALSILDTTNGTKSVKGNIRTSEIADIIYRTEYAFKRHMDAETVLDDNLSTDDRTSPAYTVRIATGTLRGLTPAQAIADGKEQLLINQKQFLEEHLQQYPSNRAQINAIDDALNLKAKNLIGSSNTASSGCLVNLYNGGMHPLVRNTRSDGKCFVYEIKIEWQVGSKYPVSVSITNYYATAIKQADGRLNVTNQDQLSRIVLTQTMSESEWINIITSIKKNMKQFELLNAKALFNEASKAYQEALSEQ